MAKLYEDQEEGFILLKPTVIYNNLPSNPQPWEAFCNTYSGRIKVYGESLMEVMTNLGKALKELQDKPES